MGSFGTVRAGRVDRQWRFRGIRPHVAAAAVALLGGAIGWAVRPNWSADMRLWKALGDSGLLLLIVTMSLGPVARLWRPLGRLVRLRRAMGVWFAIIAALHTLLIVNGWARWSFLRFMGFEFVPELGRWARLEPGFGLANLIGAVAMAWAVALALTSNDRAVKKLGARGWKWLHNTAHVVFYLVALHTAYFLFLHYTASFHRLPPPPNPLRWPILILMLAVIGAQMIAFRTEVRRKTSGRRETVKASADVGAMS